MAVITRPSPQRATTRWKVDAPASSAEFSVRQFWGLSTVHGAFTGLAGELELDASGAGRAALRLDAASVETGNRRRDRHLRRSDYFDCDRHQYVRFTATVVSAPDGHLGLTGELEAGGRVIPFDVVARATHAGDTLQLAATASLDAREIGMAWSPVGKLKTPTQLSVVASLRRES